MRNPRHVVHPLIRLLYPLPLLHRISEMYCKTGFLLDNNVYVPMNWFISSPDGKRKTKLNNNKLLNLTPIIIIIYLWTTCKLCCHKHSHEIRSNSQKIYFCLVNTFLPGLGKCPYVLTIDQRNDRLGSNEISQIFLNLWTVTGVYIITSSIICTSSPFTNSLQTRIRTKKSQSVLSRLLWSYDIKIIKNKNKSLIWLWK